MRYPINTKLLGSNGRPCTVTGHGLSNNGYPEYQLIWTTCNIKDRWSKDGVEGEMTLVSLPPVLPEDLFKI